MADNVCLDHGLLVGMEFAIPADEHDYYAVANQIVGCNRVFCKNCQSWVRHFDHYRIWRQQLPLPEHERLYDAADPAPFKVLRPDPDEDGFRTYICRCSWADCAGLKRLRYGDIDGWSCAGHPAR